MLFRSADEIDDFYRGKTIVMVIPTSVGGEYDLHGRMIARFLGRHIPGNPKIVPHNMAGGGGLVATNFVYNISPKDGTTILVVNKALPAAQAMDEQGLKADMGKFSYIGTLSPSSETMGIWHTAKIKSIEEAVHTEIVIGTTGTDNITYMFPKLMNALLGTKFKLVTGYPGGNEINIAMERGEVSGRQNAWTSWKATKSDWIKNGEVQIIAQGGSKIKELPNVPDVEMRAKNDDDRKVFQLILNGSRLGRGLLAPPGVPIDRIKVLLEAFNATMKDPDFLAACRQAKIDVDPVMGDDLQETVRAILSLPKSIGERTKKLLL